MEEKKISKQKAGKGSIQVSVDRLMINNGLSESEVRAIIQAEAAKIIAEANESAKQIADYRVESFSEVLIKRLIESDNLAELQNPAMHLLIRKAQEAAICTDNKSDHEILSELLVYRAEHPNDKNTTSSVKKAISEIDSISRDALDALTMSFSVMAFTPVSGSIEEGLQAIDALFGKLLRNISLPEDNEWIENLEITNLIRVSPFGRLKKYNEIAHSNFSGYYVLGIKKESDNYNKAISLLTDNNVPTNILIENCLNDNYLRIAVPSLGKIDKMEITDLETGSVGKFSNTQIKAINKVLDLYEKSGENYNGIESAFDNQLLKYENIVKAKEWWDRIVDLGICFNITSVGKVLAITNARRINPSLPDLNNKS